MRSGRAIRAAALTLLFLGCGRPPEPVLVPPAEITREFLGEVDRRCREIVDYEARGTVNVRRGVWEIDARERVLYLAPDRLRFSVESGGIFGLGAMGADFLVRGDSLYLHVSGQGTIWAGLKEGFNERWPDRAPMVWAMLDELSPGSPVGCAENDGSPGCTLIEPDLSGPASVPSTDPFSIICPAGELDRVVWIDPRKGLPEESYLHDSDETLLVQITYADYEEVGGFQRPRRFEVRYAPERATLLLEHREQSVNQGLSESDFLPLEKGRRSRSN